MARNDQHIRQWLILKALSTARGKTLEELSAALPRDYSRHPRTLRRDLEALEAAGHPIVNERIGGRVRWRLMDGYRHIPCLSLSPSEYAALLMAQHLLEPLEGTPVQKALVTALAKTSAAVSGHEQGTIKQLEQIFAFKLGPHKTYTGHRDTIECLTTAIAKQRTVQLRYYSASRRRLTRREVEPYQLFYADGALYLVGYCRLRKDVRTFAVERIRTLTLTDHPYQIPLGFDIRDYTQHSLGVMQGRPVSVTLEFRPETAAWVRDRRWHPSQSLSFHKDGRLTMRLTVAETRELIGWVLSFGSGVKVVSPRTLQQAVREEARKIVASTQHRVRCVLTDGD
ncbi:MAG: WYL domain-containing transcriptional regulator [Nitrospirae bacterium]|nr:MAG: WYL domain-containing transcriptional regulator [Nitrospirota bacterium]